MTTINDKKDNHQFYYPLFPPTSRILTSFPASIPHVSIFLHVFEDATSSNLLAVSKGMKRGLHPSIPVRLGKRHHNHKLYTYCTNWVKGYSSTYYSSQC